MLYASLKWCTPRLNLEFSDMYSFVQHAYISNISFLRRVRVWISDLFLLWNSMMLIYATEKSTLQFSFTLQFSLLLFSTSSHNLSMVSKAILKPSLLCTKVSKWWNCPPSWSQLKCQVYPKLSRWELFLVCITFETIGGLCKIELNHKRLKCNHPTLIYLGHSSYFSFSMGVILTAAFQWGSFFVEGIIC